MGQKDPVELNSGLRLFYSFTHKAYVGGVETEPPGSVEPTMSHHVRGTVKLNPTRGTASGRLFDWGGTPSKKYQRRSKVHSVWSEITRRGQGHKWA